MLGVSAAAWPLAARAQQAERMRRIGVFTGLTESNASVQPMLAAFRGALAKLGWTEGSNLLIEYHWGGGDADKMRRQAAQLATRARRFRRPRPGAVAQSDPSRADCVCDCPRSTRLRLRREPVSISLAFVVNEGPLHLVPSMTGWPRGRWPIHFLIGNSSPAWGLFA